MKIAAGLAVLALVLTGCGREDAAPADSTPTSEATTSAATTQAPQGVTVEIEFVNGEVIPLGEKVDVVVGEPVTLHVISDVAEEIHVHSDPEHEYEIAAGGDETFTFTIDTPGQVGVEAHHLDVTIVELVARP